ncbi:MAG: hypothetical protein Q8P89_02525, partial [bacterium]|nr:hypothetical protein [bacterium]
SWQEKIENSLLTFTSMTCPDKDCQKIVEVQLAAQKEKKEAMEQARLVRKELNRRPKAVEVKA